MAYWNSPSDELRLVDIQKIADGALMALRIGKWPNRWTTIHFDTANLRPNARPFFLWYLKQCRDWLAYRAVGPLSYIAVFENKGGLHVHVLMHVPYRFWGEFLQTERQWMRRGLEKHKGTYHPGVLSNKAVKHYDKLVRGHASERDYLKELRWLALYVEKGATRIDTTDYMGLDEDEKLLLKSSMQPSAQGRVWGRRVSLSHSLLSNGIYPPLHPKPERPWLEDAEREAAVGRSAHAATLEVGNPLPSTSATPKAVVCVPHRRGRQLAGPPLRVLK